MRVGKAARAPCPPSNVPLAVVGTLRFVLLRHNFCRLYVAGLVPQQGHRGRVLMSALINRRRMVAIEFGTWRSGRKGGFSGSIPFG
jgi:hypothetical protein